MNLPGEVRVQKKIACRIKGVLMYIHVMTTQTVRGAPGKKNKTIIVSLAVLMPAMQVEIGIGRAQERAEVRSLVSTITDQAKGDVKTMKAIAPGRYEIIWEVAPTCIAHWRSFIVAKGGHGPP
jgi:hypothetical protein